MCKLPPPVTKDSSKADLWDEIIALRDEVESQQTHLNNATKTAEKMKDQATTAAYQLSIIRQVLSMEFQ